MIVHMYAKIPIHFASVEIFSKTPFVQNKVRIMQGSLPIGSEVVGDRSCAQPFALGGVLHRIVKCRWETIYGHSVKNLFCSVFGDTHCVFCL